MVSSIEGLYQKYEEIYKVLKSFQDEYDKASKHLEDFKIEDEAVRQARIANFDKQLKSIGAYYARIEYFRQLAEKNITSKNVASLKAVEIDFNSLRYDAARIDTQNPNDPYAYRLFVKTRCNEIYLMQKQKEFEEKREELLSGKNKAYEEMKTSVEKAQEEIENECVDYIKSEEFSKFVGDIKYLHAIYDTDLYSEKSFEGLPAYKLKDTVISLGMMAQPLPIVSDKAKQIAKSKLTTIDTAMCYFDENSQNILMPVKYDISKEVCVYVRCSTVKANRCFKGVNNFILNRLVRTKSGDRNIVVNFIDALHYNNSQLKALKPLEGTTVLEKVPQSTEAIDDTLRRLVASFTDMDEKLQDYENVYEYNKANPDNKITNRLVVLNGYPKAFNDNSRKCIDRIIYNHQRYGISIILIENTGYDKIKENKTDKIGSAANVYYIDMPVGATSTIQWDNDVRVGFRWYEYDLNRMSEKHSIPSSFVEDVKKDTTSNKIDNEYIKRLPLESWEYKDRSDETRKDIVLPYGVDSDGNISSVSFNNESFAAYLMGASGSGKSTLLHTLITDIIRNYHPDDVELWLADFKMAEFAQYINPLPPHVKYILLDESRELVFDLVDKLTEEMIRRQRFFMIHKKEGIKKVEKVPAKLEYMPIIFVILDEFSIMSQVLESDEVYKIKLQNLLAKGRALGIKFIFSSQSYMTGIRGLTNTAKEQIQTRIAMKNNIDEINETLELPRFLKSEQNTFMIETLPVHMALRKYHKTENEMVLERVNVMYFKGDAEEMYEPQRKLIKEIKTKLKPIDREEYTGEDNGTYIKKKTVIVDGNSFEAFNNGWLDQYVKDLRGKNYDEIAPDDTILSFGNPRKMEKIKYSIISKEARENILLVSKLAEQACAASIMISIIKMYLMQDRRVTIWTYEKNRLFKRYKNEFVEIKSNNLRIVCGIDDICGDIKAYKEKISSGHNDNEIIIMLGMDHICADFDYIDNKKKGNIEKKEDIAIKGTVVTPMQQAQVAFADEFIYKLWPEKEIELKKMGITGDDLKEEKKSFRRQKFKEFYLMHEEEYKKEKNDENKTNEVKEPSKEESKNEKAYNAKDDFAYIVKCGSRLGYHFMLQLNAYSDLKTTGLKNEYFRYKMAFQESVDDSRSMFSSRVASELPEHICQFDDTLEGYSFRPYLHEGVVWDGWNVENGKAISPFV